MRDIVIIGGGPGGYVAAIRGAQLGARVCLIEMDRVGGTCLNWGCIPTKALYKHAEILRTLDKSNTYGIHVEAYAMDVQQVQERKQTIVDKLVGGVQQLLKSNHVEVIKGKGIMKDAHHVIVEKEDGTIEEIEGKHLIIATGSLPDTLPLEGIDEEGVWNTNDILAFEEVPEKLAIIGGGVVGMEFASIFNGFGSDVSVLEYLPQILNQVDSAISKRFKSMAKKSGIAITTQAEVKKIVKTTDGLDIHYRCKGKEHILSADKVLVAAGRRANLAGLELDGLGIAYTKKGIQVNENYETSVKGIYAIGDVNGKSMLAHVASHQGVHVVEHIMGMAHKEEKVVPSCIFVFPEIAYAGITEDEAKEQDIPVRVGKFMFSANGKAMTLGKDEGFVKLIAHEETHDVLGMHILGPHASDLIHEGVLAIQNGLKIEDMIETIHAHPTLAEAIHEAALDVLDLGIHSLPKKK
ncbi:dihydrolipoyl dehydrogenase [Vallitalea pronyensis]|uniref:Dihydrolipoyl dehydrogenase n=1 Tax=Vallitalea pronyensis TaxID=1348613 RepID=A0A8J8MJT8_9FIRM|nr:dihydrolipoyl dehydrogenase [Vallitalea pronyensis]QUI23132.1 dihydrolipoyl dehydrogenase [Vallitalea pronyensis]